MKGCEIVWPNPIGSGATYVPDPPGSGPYLGGFRFVDIAPVHLEAGNIYVLVYLDTSNARNSASMLGEPLPHFLVGPGPLKRVGVKSVVLRCGS